MKEVLIVSSSIDSPTYGPVADKLAGRGYDPVLYLADRVFAGVDKFAISLSPDEKISTEFTYNDKSVDLSTVRSAWYRHPQLLNIDMEDKAKQNSIEREATDLQDSFWPIVTETAWLNAPEKMRKAQAKIAQLSIAKEIGFEIPTTVVANSWEDIDESLGQEDIIVKMPRGVLFGKDKTRVLYTTRLGVEDREKMRTNQPFPAIYQTYGQKHREWRITVVEDDFFDAAIYTAEDAKDDWRVYQLTDRVEFKSESINPAIHDLCSEYLTRADLRFGAFDFIEDADGKITFLECNSNGQFRWLEELLEFPISDAIVGALIKRADADNEGDS